MADAKTPRFRLWHLPGCMVRHACDPVLRIPTDWQWTKTFTTYWNSQVALPTSADQQRPNLGTSK